MLLLWKVKPLLLRASTYLWENITDLTINEKSFTDAKRSNGSTSQGVRKHSFPNPIAGSPPVLKGDRLPCAAHLGTRGCQQLWACGSKLPKKKTDFLGSKTKRVAVGFFPLCTRTRVKKNHARGAQLEPPYHTCPVDEFWAQPPCCTPSWSPFGPSWPLQPLAESAICMCSHWCLGGLQGLSSPRHPPFTL